MTWKPNPDQYGPGGGDYTGIDGSSTPDPFGSLAPPAPAGFTNTMGGFPSSATPGAPATDPTGINPSPGQNPGSFAASHSLGAPPPLPGPGKGVGAPPALPGPGKGVGALPPEAAMPEAAAVPALIPTTERKEGSTGPDKASAARISAGIESTDAASATAQASATNAKQVEADVTKQRALRTMGQAAEALKDDAAKQAVLDHIDTTVQQKLDAGAAWRPNPTELFHGDHGVLFGISAAVAAMAGGWLSVRQNTTNQYLPIIMKMIDDNVKDQVRQNSSMMQTLRDQKGDVKAAMSDLRGRMLAHTQQVADGLALKDQSTMMQAGVTSFRDQLGAERAKERAKQQAALTTSVTNEVTHKLIANPAAKAGALPRSLQGRYFDNNMIQDKWRNTRATIVAAQQSGAAESYLGTVATHGVTWVQEHLNGLPPEQQKFAIAMNELRVLNHLANNIPGISADEKEKLGETAVPTKAVDLQNTLGHFDELYHMKARENAEMLKGAGHGDAEGEPDADSPQGTF